MTNKTQNVDTANISGGDNRVNRNDILTPINQLRQAIEDLRNAIADYEAIYFEPLSDLNEVNNAVKGKMAYLDGTGLQVHDGVQWNGIGGGSSPLGRNRIRAEFAQDITNFRSFNLFPGDYVNFITSELDVFYDGSNKDRITFPEDGLYSIKFTWALPIVPDKFYRMITFNPILSSSDAGFLEAPIFVDFGVTEFVNYAGSNTSLRYFHGHMLANAAEDDYVQVGLAYYEEENASLISGYINSSFATVFKIGERLT